MLIISDSLTKEERAWCRAMEKLLLATPARFGLSTIGDCSLDVFDESAVESRGVDIADGGAGRAGLSLCIIRSRVNIHSLSG